MDPSEVDMQGDLSAENIVVHHISIVRFGACQVWGHMVGGFETRWKHTTWFKRTTHKIFGHVRAIHENEPNEVVLEIDGVFKSALVARLYDFLWTLVLWWTSSEVIDEYMTTPPNYRMQHTFQLVELALQPPFDGRTPDATAQRRRLKQIKETLETCDHLCVDVFEVNKTLSSKKKTPELLKYLTYLSSSLKNIRDFCETQETAEPRAKIQLVDPPQTEMTAQLASMSSLLVLLE